MSQKITRQQIKEYLLSRGQNQIELQNLGRSARDSHWGQTMIIRGLIEVTNKCRVNCLYCPMRRDNTRVNSTFILTPEQIIETARKIKEYGLSVVFLQAGEIPQTTKIVGEVLPTILDVFNNEVEIILCLGNKTRDEYQYLKDQGATTYIIKHETSDVELNEMMREDSWTERLRCINDLISLGFKVGTGVITGLPNQTIDSLIDDLFLSLELGVHMFSASPLIPAPNTPLAAHPAGSLELALNYISVARILNPAWLIPSVSAFEKLQAGGQLRGMQGGANVLTINFSPPSNQEKYLIYGKDRYIVKDKQVEKIIQETRLTPIKSPFCPAMTVSQK